MDIFLKIGQIWGGDNTIFEFLARFWGGTTDFSPQIWGEATSYYSPKNQVWGGSSPTDPKMGGVGIWRPKAADLKHPPLGMFLAPSLIYKIMKTHFEQNKARQYNIN